MYAVHTKYQLPDDRFPLQQLQMEKTDIQPFPAADIPQLIRCVAGIPY